MPNLRGKTWTTTTPANVEDAQYWEDHLISDAQNAKILSSVQSVNSISPDADGNVDIVALPPGGTTGQVLTKVSNTSGDADWENLPQSGHTIQNPSGSAMTDRTILQFLHADVSDDPINGKTIVDCQGEKGDAATVTVGTTTTLSAGSDATVSNSGTSSDAIFDFGIPRGADGSDGYSPEVTITSTTGGHTITITDEDHPSGQSFTVTDGTDGTDGQDGADGVSPEITITSTTGGHIVNITDADHPSGQDFSVMDGINGTNGTDGADGADGISVTGVSLYSTIGKEKTYRMTFSQGSPFDYVVTDGADGSGAGDMLKSEYDPNSTVYNAGGITNYVSGVLPVITNTYSGTSEDGMSGKAVASALSGLSIPVITNTYSSTSEDGMSGKAVASAISGKADSSSLATVATSGLYSDLTGTPTIPAAQVNSDWNASSGVAQILNKPTIPVITNTYSSSSNDGMSGVAVASAISGKADDSDLDNWTATATASTVGSDVVVVFDDLSNSYGYNLYCQDELIGIKSMTKGTGTNTGIKLTYVLDGATSGVTVCKLRILK